MEAVKDAVKEVVVKAKEVFKESKPLFPKHITDRLRKDFHYFSVPEDPDYVRRSICSKET